MRRKGRGRRIEGLIDAPHHEIAFQSVPPDLRRTAERHYARIIAKWMHEHRPITSWRIACAHAVAANLTLHPRDEAWARSMMGKKAAKASVKSPGHYPIARARAARKFAAQRRKAEREYQEALKLNPLAMRPIPPGRRSGSTNMRGI